MTLFSLHENFLFTTSLFLFFYTEMSRLQSSWNVAAAAGESHAVIRVQNLQTTAEIDTDAWGRPGKLQPVLISATVALREPFEAASTEDSVKGTVHYGILSKAILEAATRDTARGSLMHFYTYILCYLLHTSKYNHSVGTAIVDSALARSLSIEISLPKASLLGSGISVFGTKLLNIDRSVEMYSMGMKFHDLRIPTLIGVNYNERLAKQIVIANVEIDQWENRLHEYVRFEELIFKVSACPLIRDNR
jgi:dihydroneopterin aldolase